MTTITPAQAKLRREKKAAAKLEAKAAIYKKMDLLSKLILGLQDTNITDADLQRRAGFQQEMMALKQQLANLI